MAEDGDLNVQVAEECIKEKKESDSSSSEHLKRLKSYVVQMVACT